MDWQRLGTGLGAIGTSLRGGDGMAMVEREQRKEAISGLMDRMGIAGPKKDILATMPVENQSAALWDMMNPQPVQGKVIGDKLVNPFTGAVIGDFGPETLSTGDFMNAIGLSESGNDWGADNGEGYVGRVQFGEARLQDFANAMGTGPITLEQFRSDPQLQMQAEQWHFNDLAQHADKYAHLYGTNIGGVPFTREGAMGIAHLGGKGGLDRYVQTGGRYNPADSNGTRLSDYQARFAGTTFGQPSEVERLERLLLDPRLTPPQREYIERKIQRTNAANKPGFRVATPEEAKQYGAQAGQFGPDGRFYPINLPKGMSIRVGEDGSIEIVEGAGVAGNPKFNEVESKTNIYHTRAVGALQVLEPIASELTNPLARGVEGDPTGIVRGAVQSDEFQVAKNAGDEFLQAILRKDTGAAITVPEQYLYGRTYLPQPGDSDAVLKTKSDARKRAVAALESGMSAQQMLASERARGEIEIPETAEIPSGSFESFSKQAAQDADVQQAIEDGLTLEEIWKYHPDNPDNM